MRRATIGTLLLLLATAARLSAQVGQPVLAVLDVTTVGTEESKGQIVHSYITDLVNKSGAYLIVERSQLERAMREIELGASGLVDDATAVRIGSLTGASAVLISTFSKEENRFYLSMRVVDIETAHVVRTSVKQASSFDDVETITREAVDYLLGTGTAAAARARSHLSLEPSFTVGFPLLLLGEILGLGYAPSLALSLNLDGSPGSLGLGVTAGGLLSGTVSTVAAPYRLYAVVYSAHIGYTTPATLRLLVLARLEAGATTTVLLYADAPEVAPLVSTVPVLSARLGVGVRASPALGLYLSGSILWIPFEGQVYLAPGPGLGARFDFPPRRSP